MPARAPRIRCRWFALQRCSLARARTLYEGGKLHDALRLLESIDRGDPLRGDADTLTAAIQTAILATAPPLPTAGEAVR